MDAAYRLFHEIDALCGAFLDAVVSIRFHVEHIERSLADMHVSRGTASPAAQELDEHAMIAYGVPQSSGKPEYVHSVPLKRFLRRSAVSGSTTLLLGNSVVVAAFALWENRFRAAIAEEIGIEVMTLKCPLFGDLRVIRNAIVHTSGVLGPDASKLCLIDWLKAGDQIAFDETRIIWLVKHVEEFAHMAHTLRPPEQSGR